MDRVYLPQTTKSMRADRLFQTNKFKENWEKVKRKNEILNKWLSLMIIAIFSSLFPSDIGETYAESSST